MGKGTAAKGRNNGGKVHIICRRCGKHTYHATRAICSSCGFGKSPRMRSYAWAKV